MSLSARLGRPMLAAVFINGGIEQLRDTRRAVPAAEQVAEDLGEVLEDSPLPSDPETMVKVNGAVQVVAGAMLATNRFPRLASLALAGSLIPTTYGAHRFWEATDPDARQQQQIHFFKNVAMLGGLLVAAGDTGGRPSISWRARRALKRSDGPSASDVAETTAEVGRAASRAATTATHQAGELATTVGHNVADAASTAAEVGVEQAKSAATTLRRAAEVAVPVISAAASQVAEQVREKAVPTVAEAAEQVRSAATPRAADAAATIASTTKKVADRIPDRVLAGR